MRQSTRRGFLAGSAGVSIALAGCIVGGNEDAEKAVDEYETVISHFESGIEEFESGIVSYEANEHSSAQASFQSAIGDFDAAESAYRGFEDAAIDAGVNESELHRFTDTYRAILAYQTAANTFEYRASQTDDGADPAFPSDIHEQQRIDAETSQYPPVDEVESTMVG